jgi:hypothetical protein
MIRETAQPTRHRRERTSSTDFRSISLLTR